MTIRYVLAHRRDPGDSAMSEDPVLPNSSFSDKPIRPAPPPNDTAGRDMADILAPIGGDADDDGDADPPYPFNTFSLFRQIQASQADARDLLGL
jgi:hypothetical protein